MKITADLNPPQVSGFKFERLTEMCKDALVGGESWIKSGSDHALKTDSPYHYGIVDGTLLYVYRRHQPNPVTHLIELTYEQMASNCQIGEVYAIVLRTDSDTLVFKSTFSIHCAEMIKWETQNGYKVSGGLQVTTINRANFDTAGESVFFIRLK